ncbi:repressor LexA [Caldicoprobacter guelmensis]|uniref:transcriptional repressor LexA n=1 Tax=Caldicoprobacter guelmensis TaxID=1170224 RepID=UPI00195849B2|nr:transcriptional repressor LexA [Caldicoprobacter guelmensis]MBM7581441.1 repressor LexA [Caldicoprobacter guelmensis]
MYQNITDKQRKVLEFIKKELKKKGYPPSVREICEGLGIRSTSTVHGYLERLEKNGLIRRDPTKPRAIEILEDTTFLSNKEVVNVPIIGQVTAGKPILAVENIEDTFPIPAEMLPNSNVFMLRVKGESMIEAGILDGDYVIVKQQPHADNGDIVVALIEDEATVKRFYKEKDHVRLQPENRYMDPIIAREVSILGKVIGVIRLFNR